MTKKDFYEWVEPKKGEGEAPVDRTHHTTEHVDGFVKMLEEGGRGFKGNVALLEEKLDTLLDPDNLATEEIRHAYDSLHAAIGLHHEDSHLVRRLKNELAEVIGESHANTPLTGQLLAREAVDRIYREVGLPIDIHDRT